MIDEEGYRHGVGIILVNTKRQLFLAKRIGKMAWQFPQGGMKENETPEQAMYRELNEEIGLKAEDVKVLSTTRRWLRYRLPERLIRHYSKPICIGQKQKWFLLRLRSEDTRISLNNGGRPEFDGWRWVSYWYPLGKVVSFKKDVYRRALKELSLIHAQLELEMLAGR